MGAVGAKRVFRWLNATGRFSMSHTVYDTDPVTGDPTDHCRVELMDGSGDNFDLFGHMLAENAAPADRLYVECKEYSSSANQGQLYREYLSVCYSAFHRRWTAADQEPAMQFMWATTHPFLVTEWAHLREWETIRDACQMAEHQPRLNGNALDESVARELASRLWICVVNDRVDEMIMGDELLKALRGAMVTVGGA